MMIDKLRIHPLKKDEKIAFICSACLGDALIAMVTVNNLVRNGYTVDVFGNFIYALRDWFPWVSVFPGVQIDEQEKLSSYPAVLFMYDCELAHGVIKWHANAVILSASSWYKARISMVDIQMAICQQEWGLSDIVRNNNIQILPGLNLHRDKHRIIIHPTSSLERKNWPKHKFIKLAQHLIQQSYTVHFIVAPNERSGWLDVVNYGIDLPEFPSLSDLAAFVYESAYFIGNDSGIGHLASNLGIPTVSIILRKGVARQWRPAWAPSEVVLSPSWLNPRPVKEKFWKYCISVKMVLRQFALLRQRSTFGALRQGKAGNNYYSCYEKYFTVGMQKFLQSPDYYLENSPGPFFKNDTGDTTTVGVIVIDDKEFVVKKYNIKGIWHFLRKCWRSSNAKKSWDSVHYLWQMGITTLTPVAVIEQRFAFLRGKAYFISEYVAGVRGCDYFAEQATPTPQWETVMRNIVVMLRQMNQARIVHQDLQWGNILIANEQPLLLDLDHIRVYKRNNAFYRHAWQKDVEHFKKFIAANPAAHKMFCEIYARYF